MAFFQELVAAASRKLGRKNGGGGGGATGNSTLAWDMFESVPEVGTYADWVSNAMSGATLFAGKRGPDGTVYAADPDSRAAQLVASIAGGPDGQSVMLGDFGTHLAVTGDCWLIILPDPDSDSYVDDRWVVLSTEEVKASRGKVKATIDGEEIEIPEYDPDVPQDVDTPVAMRVWKPSPRKREQATSPVVRALVVLEELRLLNAAVAAIAKSRITGRGVMLVPSGTRFPAQSGQDSAEDSLLDTFIEVSSVAIREPDSAAATVPIVLEVPADAINGVKWLQFTSEFDAMALQLRDEAVRRFAVGADVPAEVLLGLGDSNHWGAWAITAEALRMGAEPRLALVCQALTTEWLRPLLDFDNEPDANEWLVWYDTSGLRSSSNKGASALDAYDKGLISDQAARRELGFTEKDAPGADPDAEDRTQDRTATTENERGDLPVNETQSAPQTMPDGQDAPDGMTASVRRARKLSARDSRAVLDSFTADTSAALAEAVDGLVWAALSMAGQRITLTPSVPRADRPAARTLVTAGQVHTRFSVTADGVAGYKLLDDAWVRVPDVAARYGLDPLALASALNTYVSGLLVTGEPHRFEHVPRLLAQVKVAEGAAA